MKEPNTRARCLAEPARVRTPVDFHPLRAGCPHGRGNPPPATWGCWRGPRRPPALPGLSPPWPPLPLPSRGLGPGPSGISGWAESGHLCPYLPQPRWTFLLPEYDVRTAQSYWTVCFLTSQHCQPQTPLDLPSRGQIKASGLLGSLAPLSGFSVWTPASREAQGPLQLLRFVSGPKCRVPARPRRGFRNQQTYPPRAWTQEKEVNLPEATEQSKHRDSLHPPIPRQKV